MRTSAFTAAILTLSTIATSVSANEDFSALLADLSFGDAPTLNEPLAVAEEDTIANLKPVPTGITMPEMVESTPSSSSQHPRMTRPSPQPCRKRKRRLRSLCKILFPRRRPTFRNRSTLTPPLHLQDVQPTVTAVPSQAVSHIFDSCTSEGCDAGIVCRPRTTPNLPKSTLLQYFRSNACYTNVWDGYNQDCGSHHKHLHGECDCFNKSGKHGCGHGGCESCDSGCDR